ncbi:MAG: hypothetical protein ACLQVJ_17370 [Syntrophobacteraceae bacterium]
MSGTNLLKHFFGMFIFIWIICLFPVSPSVARGATLADLAGIWNINSFATGSSVPWWQSGTMTVQQDGTFISSAVESNGNVGSIGSGALSITPNGIALTSNDTSQTSLCQINSGNTVLVCTDTSAVDGSSHLTIFTKQAASCSMADLVGNWNANLLSSGPTPWWARMNGTAYPDGTLTGTVTADDETQRSVSGEVSISPIGVLTCLSGGCLSSPNNYTAFMDAGKTVSVGTGGASTTAEDAVLSVFTRQAASYSMADLTGTWQGNSLASGPGAPYWKKDIITVSPDGTYTGSYTASDESSDNTNGTLSISSDGLVTFVSGDRSGTENLSGVMNADKTVMVFTCTWPDGVTREIEIFTKAAFAGATATGSDAQAAVKAKAGQTQGALTVTITPAGAVAAGAKWNVDGGAMQASGTTVGGLSVGSHTVGFNSITGWNPPAGLKVNIANGKTAAVQAKYVQQTGFITGITVGPPSGAEWAVDGGAWRASGVKVTVPVGSHTVSFKPVKGWETPGPQTVTVTNGGNAEATGTYIQPLFFTLSGSLGAVSKGGFFSYQIGSKTYGGGAGPPYTFSLNTGSFPPLGITVAPSGLISGVDASPPGIYSFSLCVTDAAGTEACTGDTAITVTGGSLTVTIEPAEAIADGAQWNVDGGGLQSSGVTVSGLSVGKHTVAFSSISGWTTPASKTVTIANDKTAAAAGTYVQKPQEQGDYSGSCTAVGSPITCCADGYCDTVPGTSVTVPFDFEVPGGMSISALQSQACKYVIEAEAAAGCVNPTCSVTSSGGSFTIGLSCSVQGVDGCSTETVTESCSASLQ